MGQVVSRLPALEGTWGKRFSPRPRPRWNEGGKTGFPHAPARGEENRQGGCITRRIAAVQQRKTA